MSLKPVSGRRMPARARTIVIIFALGAMLFSVVSISHVQGMAGTAAVSRYPMWKLLPTSSFATLMDRTADGLRIGIYAFGRKGNRRDACIQQIAVKSNAGQMISASTAGPECRVMSPNRGFAAALGSFRRHRTTALGVINGQMKVARIDAEWMPGGVVSRRAKVLNAFQASKAHVVPLHYAVMTIPEVACLEKVRGFDASGREMFGTGSRGC